MAEITFAVLLVAYHNHEEVESFIAHLRAHLGGSAQFAVCDNSESAPDWSAGSDVVHVQRPENPGYLDGALAAWRALSTVRPSAPDWIVLSNSDLYLDVEGEGWADAVSNFDPDHSIILAPRITEGVDHVEKNPHVKYPRSLSRHRVNAMMTRTQELAYCYLLLSAVRHRVRVKLGRRYSNNSGSPGQRGETMFSPYGALVFFSRGFMDSVALPQGVPLLAEEFAIGQAARERGTPVVYEPTLHVFHDAHSVTGPKLTIRRARMLSRAFRYIHQSAKRAEDG